MGREITIRGLLQDLDLRVISNPNPHLASHVWPLSEDEVRSLIENRPGHKATHWKEVTDQLRYPTQLIRKKVSKIIRATQPLSGMTVMERRYALETRLYVGLGASAWELGLAYLNPYGIPWVPGSSLKGAMRAAMTNTLLEMGVSLEEVRDIMRGEMGSTPSKVSSKFTERGREISEAVKTLVELFGTAGYRGRLVVIGGFATSWTEGPPISPEVMTPHYRDYYSDEGGGRIPSETESPKPISFPVIREGTTFTFLLAAPTEKVKEVDSLLEETLTRRGVGAKRSSGFGLFRRVG